MNKINLLNFNLSMMEEFLVKRLNQKKFVAKQIFYWIYKKFCFDFFLMNNLSLYLRNELNYYFKIKLPILFKYKISCDKTIKLFFNVNGDIIETVYIPEKKRNTLCISTQVGCMLNCSFCSTGKMGFKRNLNISEIIGQLLFVMSNRKKFNFITNIVFMGMGEPLLNFYNVVNSINIILDKKFFSFSKRKVVLSTSGITPMIYKLKNYIDVILTWSLHASNDKLRNKIMPINKKYNINSILDSIIFYINNTKANRGKIYIEYIMIDKFNDNIINVYELVSLFKNFSVKFNLISLNNNFNNIYCKSSNNRIFYFNNLLKENGIFSYIRKVRGLDIFASCGQLSGIFD